MAKMIQVQALISFVGRIDGKRYAPKKGDMITIPATGHDWLDAGLVELIDEKKAKVQKAA